MAASIKRCRVAEGMAYPNEAGLSLEPSRAVTKNRFRPQVLMSSRDAAIVHFKSTRKCTTSQLSQTLRSHHKCRTEDCKRVLFTANRATTVFTVAEFGRIQIVRAQALASSAALSAEPEQDKGN